ncbi:hypothetical protein IFR05_000792 [Cadophora sp. M221]|nr:hypothetical protein IFR05_000792 [Cadophora sp. M221]
MVHNDSEWKIVQDVGENALRETIYACQSLERLPGGRINFTFRNQLAAPIEGWSASFVVKMTEDKLKVEKPTGKEFTLHRTRSYYEHQVLSHQIPSFWSSNAQDGSASIVVRVPEVLQYFPGDHIQIIEDLPNTSTLKAHLLNKYFEPAFAYACGRAVGSWAVKFHGWGRHLDQEGLRGILSTYKEAGIFKFSLSCGRLDATIAKFPELPGSRKTLFKQVSERISAITHRDADVGIIHGDFWPGK